MNDCTHTTTTERQGHAWTDEHGKLHTIIYTMCANPFCVRFGQAIRVRQTGDDTPTRYTMPPIHIRGMKP